MARALAVLATLAFLGLGAATTALAQSVPPPASSAPTTGGLIDRLSPACSISGTCDFCDVLDGFAIVTRWLLGVSGTVALVLFVWFGFKFIISSGSSEVVSSAKKGLVGTVAGLAIVFGAWEIINVVLYVSITSSSQTNINDRPSLTDVVLFRDSSGGSTPWSSYCANRPKDPGRIPGVTE